MFVLFKILKAREIMPSFKLWFPQFERLFDILLLAESSYHKKFYKNKKYYVNQYLLSYNYDISCNVFRKCLKIKGCLLRQELKK